MPPNLPNTPCRLFVFGQSHPLLRGGIANHVYELIVSGGRDVVQAAEDEAVAGVEDMEAPSVGQEIKGGVDEG